METVTVTVGGRSLTYQRIRGRWYVASVKIDGAELLDPESDMSLANPAEWHP